MNERIYNFNPGPAVLPEDVLREVQAELLNFNGTGMSILEISHRAPAYDEVHQQTKADIKELMGLCDSAMTTTSSSPPVARARPSHSSR